MKITYLGHACFKIESQGYSIVIDPYGKGYVPGYRDVNTEAHMTLCTHTHGDHNAVDEVKQLTTDVDNPFKIMSLDTWHDHSKGAHRGTNRVYIIEAEGMKVVHLGDLGCMPEKEQIEAIRNCDLLMIPVGGHYTINAEEAKQVADMINPKHIVPMHYSGSGFGYDVIAPVTDFLKLEKDAVEYTASKIVLSTEEKHRTIVLKAARLV